MADLVRYYAIIGRGRTLNNPSGLARRRSVSGISVDESLRRDMSWGETSAIAEWDRGEELSRDLIEISEADAAQLIERFREKWDTQQGSGNRGT
jgi:hypothetical protein